MVLSAKGWSRGGACVIKSLSPKTCKRGTAFLLTARCFALPKAQSSHGRKVTVTDTKIFGGRSPDGL